MSSKNYSIEKNLQCDEIFGIVMAIFVDEETIRKNTVCMLKNTLGIYIYRRYPIFRT